MHSHQTPGLSEIQPFRTIIARDPSSPRGVSFLICQLILCLVVVAWGNGKACRGDEKAEPHSPDSRTSASDFLRGSFGDSLLGTPFKSPRDPSGHHATFFDPLPPLQDADRQIQQVLFVPQESRVTFLRASQTTDAGTKSQDAPRQDELPPAEKPLNQGNVMVIPQQPAAATKTQTPPVETPPTQPAVPAATVDADVLTPETVTSRQVTAEQTPDIPEDVKAQATKHYQRATELLTQKADADKKAAEYKAEKDNGPALIAEHRAIMSQPAPKSEPEYPATSSVSDLEKLRLVDEERAAAARQQLDAWESRAKLRTERKPQLPSLIETTRQQLTEIEKAMSAPAPEGEPPVLTQARRTEHEAMLLLLRSQLELYRQEQLRNEAWNDLFPLQRDVLLRNRNAADKRMELWKDIIASARRTESEQQAREAREKLQNAHPTLRDLAEENSSLTQRRRELQGFLARQVSDLSAVNSTLTSVEQKFNSVVEKEQRAGLTTAIGLLLRNQRSHLPDADEFDRRQAEAEVEIVRLQTEQMSLEDDRSELGDIEARVDLELRLNGEDEAMQTRLRQMTLDLLTDRRQYLDDLLADYDACLQTLSEIDVVCRRLQTTIKRYEEYIDERVLWIRSAAPVNSTLIMRTWSDVLSFLSHRQWSPLLGHLYEDAATYWPLYGVCGLLLLLILVLNQQIRRFLLRTGELRNRPLESGIPLALMITALAVVRSSAWPAGLLFAGWRLSLSGLDLALALGHGFDYCAYSLWVVESARVLCRENSVAVKFLEWPVAIARSLRANLLFYIACGIPLCLVVVTTENLGDGSGTESIGRLAFVLFCGLLAFLLRKLVRPSGILLGSLLRSNTNSLMYRIRWIWYPLAVGSPLLLAGLALMGYLYTAEQLMIRLQLTLVLSFVLIFSYSMLMQWMLAARRNLAIRQARAKRAAALAAAQREVEEGAASSPIPPAEIPEINISLLNQQAVQLVTGLACLLFLSISWGIWAQVLPALQVFSRIELWTVLAETSETTVPVTEPAAAPLSVIPATSGRVPITLGHLLTAVIVFSAAILASRNIPGLLELGVLQRLPLDHGGRNAITTVCRYAFLLLGVILASNTLGISWGSVQWLAAALTVGLGFGLQEIFANFVSGLIILFERPVRIGDIVTIDGVSGSVSRIEIRATTITDWDRKEFIIPNKELVTGKVLNWTLTDKTNRIVINVGVAYAADVELAMRLLQQIADDDPLVLLDPAPVVSFEGLGDSTLNLVLRCFLPNLDHRLKVISQLHSSIIHKFREAGIEIAFPQRDIHIRSLPSAAVDSLLSAGQTPMDSSPMKSESNQLHSDQSTK
jgi:potassium efflux system protein